MIDSFKRGWTRNKGWIGKDVVVVFAITRLALLLVGWFSRYFPPEANYPAREAVRQGWQFSSRRLLDIWGRWDSGWYASIVYNGYTVEGDLDSSQSNIAFFPLYPSLVRTLFHLLPEQFQSLESMLSIGVLVSNLFFLGSLIILYRLVIEPGEREAVARRSVTYLLLFPTSFIFSCFYTEATYLFFSIASFYAASKRRWKLASIAGCLVALTRPPGLLIVIPLLVEYFNSINWKIREIKKMWRGSYRYLAFFWHSCSVSIL